MKLLLVCISLVIYTLLGVGQVSADSYCGDGKTCPVGAFISQPVYSSCAWVASINACSPQASGTTTVNCGINGGTCSFYNSIWECGPGTEPKSCERTGISFTYPSCCPSGTNPTMPPAPPPNTFDIVNRVVLDANNNGLNDCGTNYCGIDAVVDGGYYCGATGHQTITGITFDYVDDTGSWGYLGQHNTNCYGMWASTGRNFTRPGGDPQVRINLPAGYEIISVGSGPSWDDEGKDVAPCRALDSNRVSCWVPWSGYTAYVTWLIRRETPSCGTVTYPTCWPSSGNVEASVTNVQNGWARFPTWDRNNGQNDLQWYVGNHVGSNVWNVSIPATNHNEGGTVAVHVYATNGSGPYEVNTPCGGRDIPRCVPTPTPTPATYTISGRVWEDRDNSGSITGSDSLWTGSSLSLSAQRLSPLPAIGNNTNTIVGNYSFPPSLPTLWRVTLNMSGYPAWECRLPSTCARNANIGPNASGIDFLVGLIDSGDAWFQTLGGDVAANEGNFSDSIHTGEFLSLPLGAGVTTTGILTYSGSADLGDGEVANNARDYRIQSVYDTNPTVLENYDYFETRLGPSQSFYSFNKPTADGIYIVTENGGDLSIDTNNWSVVNGDSFVIFIPGDLTISQDITVAQGGFLFFVVGGDITIDSNVTQLQGIYLAEDQLITESAGVGSDVVLQAQGTFVGWGGVSLGRDLSDNSNPAEVFTYRPDFIRSTPEELKFAKYHWEEVAP